MWTTHAEALIASMLVSILQKSLGIIWSSDAELAGFS
jgi:hypothetical protein